MRTLPYIFLGILVLIIAFAAGVRYGKKVESANKNTALIQKLTLAPTQKPLPTKTLEFVVVTNDPCSVSFMYPADVATTEADLICPTTIVASQEASLTKDGYMMVKNPRNNRKLWVKDPAMTELIIRSVQFEQ